MLSIVVISHQGPRPAKPQLILAALGFQLQFRTIKHGNFLGGRMSEFRGILSPYSDSGGSKTSKNTLIVFFPRLLGYRQNFEAKNPFLQPKLTLTFAEITPNPRGITIYSYFCLRIFGTNIAHHPYLWTDSDSAN
jgi:hypothetical protein